MTDAMTTIMLPQWGLKVGVYNGIEGPCVGFMIVEPDLFQLFRGRGLLHQSPTLDIRSAGSPEWRWVCKDEVDKSVLYVPGTVDRYDEEPACLHKAVNNRSLRSKKEIKLRLISDLIGLTTDRTIRRLP